METAQIKDRAEYAVATVVDFSKQHQLTTRQAFNYLKRYGGIDFIMRHYDIIHTLSFKEALNMVTVFCSKKGGLLL